VLLVRLEEQPQTNLIEGVGFGVWSQVGKQIRSNLIEGVGFGVWGLGFGVWGLGFGVWGLVGGRPTVQPCVACDGLRLTANGQGLKGFDWV
jgi:hypothetical protein